MAFRINSPEVGATLLKTFSTFAEENRRRQQLDQQANQALQSLAIKEMGVTLRERALDQSAQRTQNSLALGLGNLSLRERELDQRTKEAAIRIADKQSDYDAQEADLQAAVDLSEMMVAPNPQGKSLSQRIHSADPNEAKEALREFSSLADRYAGRGAKTQATIRNIEARLNAQQRQLLNETREARMKTQAEAAAKKSEQTGQRSLIKDQSAALRRQIKEGEKRYQDLWDAEGVAPDETERARLKAEKEDAGKKTDALKKQLEKLEGELLNPENAPTLDSAAAPSVLPDIPDMEPKKLSPELAKKFLQDAGGDKELARRMAKDQGFVF